MWAKYGLNLEVKPPVVPSEVYNYVEQVKSSQVLPGFVRTCARLDASEILEFSTVSSESRILELAVSSWTICSACFFL